MNAAHTPGPWMASQYLDNGKWGVLAGDNGIIVSVRSMSDGLGKANAHLIAAAPDLLSALSAMLTHMGMDEDEWNKPTFNQARAAIKAATGVP
jgi:hypothetical protein